MMTVNLGYLTDTLCIVLCLTLVSSRAHKLPCNGCKSCPMDMPGCCFDEHDNPIEAGTLLSHPDNHCYTKVCKHGEIKEDNHCPEGFIPIGLGCYHVGPKEGTWFEGRDYCVRKGGHLAIIDTKEEAEALKGNIDPYLPETGPDGGCPAFGDDSQDRQGGPVGICVELCSSDDNCTEGERCCSNGCGRQCMPTNGSQGLVWLGASFETPDGFLWLNGVPVENCGDTYFPHTYWWPHLWNCLTAYCKDGDEVCYQWFHLYCYLHYQPLCEADCKGEPTCNYNGKQYKCGEIMWRDPDCECSWIECGHDGSAKAVQKKKPCCVYDGEVFDNGADIFTDKCSKLICKNGKLVSLPYCGGKSTTEDWHPLTYNGSSSCYLFNWERKTYDEASRFCASRNSKLAEITSEGENEAVETWLLKYHEICKPKKEPEVDYGTTLSHLQLEGEYQPNVMHGTGASFDPATVEAVLVEVLSISMVEGRDSINITGENFIAEITSNGAVGSFITVPGAEVMVHYNPTAVVFSMKVDPLFRERPDKVANVAKDFWLGGRAQQTGKGGLGHFYWASTEAHKWPIQAVYEDFCDNKPCRDASAQCLYTTLAGEKDTNYMCWANDACKDEKYFLCEKCSSCEDTHKNVCYRPKDKMFYMDSALVDSGHNSQHSVSRGKFYTDETCFEKHCENGFIMKRNFVCSNKFDKVIYQ